MIKISDEDIEGKYNSLFWPIYGGRLNITKQIANASAGLKVKLLYHKTE
jgi:hypothetical protein